MGPTRRGFGSGRSIAALLLLGVAGTFAACNVISSGPERTGDVFDRIRSVDLLPRFPQQPENARGGDGQRPATYLGTGAELQTLTPAQRAASGEGYELNFENTPITTVAKVVLSDILGVGYTIDPRVQGTVTMASGRPVPRSDLLFVLENALRVSNVVMVKDNRGYRLIPAAEAIGSGTADAGRNPEAGYGISVVSLQHVSAPTVLKLLDSFATKPGMVRADPARNMIVIQGNGAERRQAIDTVLTFDQDWMRGQSVGIYPIKNSTPEPVIAELERIMDAGDGGLGQNLVKFQPIARQNAIMVLARKPETLRTAATWINRLDTADTTNIGVKVYRVQHGDARQMAALLNDMFLGRGGGGGGGFDAATNQLAPGSGMTTLSSGGAAGGFTGGGVGAGGGLAGGAALGGGGSTAAPSGSFASRFPVGGAGGPAGAGASAAGPGGAAGTLGGGVSVSGGVAGGAIGGFGGGLGGGVGGPAILANVRITADVTNNALLIYANQENYRIIERTLRQLDRPSMQVAVDATIAEVVLNNNLNYGVQFFIKSQDLGLGTNKGSVSLNNIAGAALSRALPGFNFILGSEAEPRLIIEALQAVTDVKVLSTPSLVVMDNQLATLQVGDQIPVATRSAVSVESVNAPVVNNIDYRNTGIILRVVPRVNQNGNVLLDIEQEISNVAGGAGNQNTLTPTVSQRRVKSSISVVSGQTVLLGGLIQERQERGRSGLPLLDQIGPLGDLFGSNTGGVARTELIIFIRPQIIRDPVDAHRVAEELRTRLGNRYGTYEPGLPRVLPRTPDSVRIQP